MKVAVNPSLRATLRSQGVVGHYRPFDSDSATLGGLEVNAMGSSVPRTTLAQPPRH